MFICQPRAALTSLALQEPWTTLPPQQCLLGCCTHTQPLHCAVHTPRPVFVDSAEFVHSVSFYLWCGTSPALCELCSRNNAGLLAWSPCGRPRLPAPQTHCRHCMWTVPASAAKGLLACLAWLACSSSVHICCVFWNLSGRAEWSLLGLAMRLLGPSFCSEQGWCPYIFISTLMSNSMSLFGLPSPSLCQHASGFTWLYPAFWHPCRDSCEGGGHPLVFHLLRRSQNRVRVRPWVTVASSG